MVCSSSWGRKIRFCRQRTSLICPRKKKGREIHARKEGRSSEEEIIRRKQEEEAFFNFLFRMANGTVGSGHSALKAFREKKEGRKK